MASSSPGQGQSAGPDLQQLCPGVRDLLREERLFLGTQFELLDWTKAQPGEDAVKLQKRRSKVKGLIQKAANAYRMKMCYLTGLRNRRDKVSSQNRGAFKEAIEILKTQCGELWNLLAGLCERGREEQVFVVKVKREICQALEEGRQSSRRRLQQAAQSQEGMEVAAPEPDAGRAVEDGSGNPQEACVCPLGPDTVEGPRVPAQSQPVRGAGVDAGPGREPSEAGGSQEAAMLSGELRQLRPRVVLTAPEEHDSCGTQGGCGGGGGQSLH